MEKITGYINAAVSKIGYLALIVTSLVAMTLTMTMTPGVIQDTAKFVALFIGFVLLWVYLTKRATAYFQNSKLNSIKSVVRHFPAASFITTIDGHILWQNDAAQSGFPAKVHDPISVAFVNILATPDFVMAELCRQAQQNGLASRVAVVDRELVSVDVNSAVGKLLVWRINDHRNDQQHTLAAQSLPMMTVTRADTITHMNNPMQQFLGAPVTSIDPVFEHLPIRQGAVNQIHCREGTVSRRVIENFLANGQREIYFIPDFEDNIIISNQADVLDSLPIPLLKLDRFGRVIMANSRAKMLLEDEEIVGSMLADQVEGLGRPISEWLLEAHSGRHLGRNEIVRAIHPTEETYIQISLERVSEDQRSYLVAVLQDATELKSLEMQFVQSQKMQAIGQLAGGVAHDFNNLLTAISGHCDLLLTDRDETDADYQDLYQIYKNTGRAAALVNQLLAFSRKQTLRPEKLDLRDSLEDLTQLLDRLVGERVRVILDNFSELSCVRADRRQLEQVLMNLVVNARDAMPAGGDIRIETRNVKLSKPFNRDRVTVPAGDYVTLRLIDQGTGIKPDKVSKIFEPFFTTKRAGKGTGLGLSMVYGIIKQMGGYVFVDSVMGSGTTFTLYFPVWREEFLAKIQEDGHLSALPVQSATTLTQAAQTDVTQDVNQLEEWRREGTSAEEIGAKDAQIDTDPARPETAPDAADEVDTDSSKKVSILLVEDEEPVRAFAARALRLKGFDVIEADSGAQALRILNEHSEKIDIFVTDVVMPGLDGPAWVAKALTERPMSRVVFMSGYAEESVADHLARIDNSVFLPKPFSLGDLIKTVNNSLH